MIPTLINERWEILLPEHRAARPEWPIWEARRMEAMWEAITDWTRFVGEAGRRPVVWDVGAEEGDMPALYQTWGADVYLIEPNPRVWPNIRAIWEANQLEGPAGWYVGLVGDKPHMPDRSDVDDTPTAGWPACAFGPVIVDHGFRHLKDGQGHTPTTTLDILRDSGWNPPDIVTMDVEGGELSVLRGAAAMLRRWKPILFVSVHPAFMRDMYGHDAYDVLRLLCGEYGYTADLVADEHEAHWMFTP